MTVEFADVEGAARTYLRAHTDVTDAMDARVFFALPDKRTYPLAVVARVGGFDDQSDAPIDQALLQIDVWGQLHTNGHPAKATATTAVLAVRQALYDLNHGPVDVDLADHTVRLLGALVQSSVYLPDPDNGRPRYALTAQFTAARLVAA